MGNALVSEAIIFLDREDAGRQLAGRFAEECFVDDVLVLGLPRGGVPVACEIAVALNAPLQTRYINSRRTWIGSGTDD